MESNRKRIVVGVDGSPASQAALRFAVEEARLRDASVVAVHAWMFVPAPQIGEPGMIPMATEDIAGELGAERAAAQRELDNGVALAFSGSPPREIESRLVEGDAGEVLAAEAGNAELVIVGSRGRGGLKSALLGSVSQHVAHHAPCPVVVVKAPTAEDV